MFFFPLWPRGSLPNQMLRGKLSFTDSPKSNQIKRPPFSLSLLIFSLPKPSSPLLASASFSSSSDLARSVLLLHTVFTGTVYSLCRRGLGTREQEPRAHTHGQTRRYGLTCMVSYSQPLRAAATTTTTPTHGTRAGGRPSVSVSVPQATRHAESSHCVFF